MAANMPGVDQIHNDNMQVEVKLSTKLKKYELQQSVFSIPAESGSRELNDLLKSLLSEANDSILFEFLIEGEYLRTNIQEYVSRTDSSGESIINIEYILQEEAPKLTQSLLHDDWVSSVDIKEDLIITGSYDNTISIWNMQGKCITAIEGHTMAVRKVLWNTLQRDKGSFISASQDQSVLIWEYNPIDMTSNCVHICKGHTRSVDCLAINPSTTQFASGSWDKMIKIWNSGTDSNASSEEESGAKKLCQEGKNNPKVRTPLATLSGHKEPVSDLLYNGDNELISSGWDHCIRLWDIGTSTNKHTLTGNKNILSISYSAARHLLVSGSADKFIRLWDTRAEGAVVKNMLSSHDGWVSAVDWSSTDENQLVSGSYDCTVKLWDIRNTLEPIHDIEKHGDKVMCLSWKKPECILSAGADCNVHVYENTSVSPICNEE